MRCFIVLAALLMAASLTGCSGDSLGEPIAVDSGGPPPVPDAGPDSDVPDTAPPETTVATPEFDPAPGTFRAAQTVTITTATEGASIHYTLDGSTPTAASPLYVSPLDVATTTTLRAIATRAGAKDSVVQSGTYTINIPLQDTAPVQFTPDGKYDYNNDIPVLLSSATAGATICYTLDRSAPSCDATSRCGQGSTEYDPQVAVQITATNTEIRAIACKRGMNASPETHANYTLTAAEPTFDPISRSPDPKPVTISTSTPGAVIHYTLDGTMPDCNSPNTFAQKGTFPAAFAGATDLRAIACKDKYDPSGVQFAYYYGTICKGHFYVGDWAALDNISHCQEIEWLEVSGPPLFDLTPLRNLARVDVDFTLRGDYGADGLHSLHGLEALTTIGGNFVIEASPNLTTLDGLSSLQTIGGRFELNDTGIKDAIGPSSLSRVGGLSMFGIYLKHVGGFSGLTEIDGDIGVSGSSLSQFDSMPALTTIRGTVGLSGTQLAALTGFDNVVELGGLFLEQNDALKRVQVFPKLTAIHGAVHIEANHSLVRLDVGNVTTVDGGIKLNILPALGSLVGLASVTQIGGDLTITACSALPNLGGLEALHSIGGNLYIADDQIATNVDALANLGKLGGNLTIVDMAVLPMCRATGLAAHLQSLGYAGKTEIHDNYGTGTCN